MSKPDNISQAIWDEAEDIAKKANRDAIRAPDEPYHIVLRTNLALALSQAYSRGLEDAAVVAERHSIEPDPDDTDPYDDYEMGGRGAARSIEAEIRALGSK